MNIEDIKKIYRLDSNLNLYKLGLVNNQYERKDEWRRIIFKGNDKEGYCILSLNKNPVKSHRVVMSLYLDRTLQDDEQVDHIDNNKINNHPSNLRIVSNRTNCQNKLIHKEGKVCGVRKVGKKYNAYISIQGKRVDLGVFDTEEEAKEAYLKAVEGMQYFSGCASSFRKSLGLHKIRGVRFDKRRDKWIAEGRKDKKALFLGYFNEKVGAINRRLEWEKEKL